MSSKRKDQFLAFGSFTHAYSSSRKISGKIICDHASSSTLENTISVVSDFGFQEANEGRALEAKEC